MDDTLFWLPNFIESCYLQSQTTVALISNVPGQIGFWMSRAYGLRPPNTARNVYETRPQEILTAEQNFASSRVHQCGGRINPGAQPGHDVHGAGQPLVPPGADRPVRRRQLEGLPAPQRQAGRGPRHDVRVLDVRRRGTRLPHVRVHPGRLPEVRRRQARAQLRQCPQGPGGLRLPDRHPAGRGGLPRTQLHYLPLLLPARLLQLRRLAGRPVGPDARRRPRHQGHHRVRPAVLALPERLRRDRQHLRLVRRDLPHRLRPPHGHPVQVLRRRSDPVGHRQHLLRKPPMADRSLLAAPDPGGLPRSATATRRSPRR